MPGDPPTVSFRSEGFGVQTAASMIGAILFIGAAVTFLLMTIGGPWFIGLFGAAIFGFFGVLMAAGAISALRRRGDDRAIEISPDGLWLPEMGKVAWSAIAEVRTESMRGVAPGSRSVAATTRYRRLGVVLVDETIRPNIATTLVSRMAAGYFAFLKQMAPGLRVGGGDPAPFGVAQIQVARSWDQILATVGTYATIVDADARGARERVLRRSAGVTAVVESPAITDAGLRELDSAIAHQRPETGHGAMTSDLGLPGPVSEAPSEARPQAAFGPQATTMRDLVGSAIWLVGPLAFAAFLTAFASPPGSHSESATPFLVLFGLLMATPGAISVWRGVGRMREARQRPVRLTVGPDGMWLPEVGKQSWDNIGEIHVERAGSTRDRSGLKVERWRIVVTTGSGPAVRIFSVQSDVLGVPFDDVIDLIRFYHPVAEV